MSEYKKEKEIIRQFCEERGWEIKNIDTSEKNIKFSVDFISEDEDEDEELTEVDQVDNGIYVLDFSVFKDQNYDLLLFKNHKDFSSKREDFLGKKVYFIPDADENEWCNLEIDHIDNRLEYLTSYKNRYDKNNAITAETKMRAVVINARISSLPQWYKDRGEDIFDGGNVRKEIGDKNDVNKSIKETILNESENFWLFNNGITVYTDKPLRVSKDGNGSVVEVFRPSILNGAQTFSTLLEHKREELEDKNGFVLLRIVYPMGELNENKIPNNGIKTRIGIALNRQKPINGGNILFGHLSEKSFFDSESNLMRNISIERKKNRDENFYFLSDFAQDFITQIYQKPGTARTNKNKILMTVCEYDEFISDRVNKTTTFKDLRDNNVYYFSPAYFDDNDEKQVDERSALWEGKDLKFIDIYDKNFTKPEKRTESDSGYDKRFKQGFEIARKAFEEHGGKPFSNIEDLAFHLITENRKDAYPSLTINSYEYCLEEIKRENTNVNNKLDSIDYINYLTEKTLKNPPVYEAGKMKKKPFVDWIRKNTNISITAEKSVAEIKKEIIRDIANKTRSYLEETGDDNGESYKMYLNIVEKLIEKRGSILLEKNGIPIFIKDIYDEVDFSESKFIKRLTQKVLNIDDSNAFKLNYFYEEILKFAGIIKDND